MNVDKEGRLEHQIVIKNKIDFAYSRKKPHDNQVSQTLDGLFDSSSYDKRFRPDFGKRPTNVEVGHGYLPEDSFYFKYCICI